MLPWKKDAMCTGHLLGIRASMQLCSLEAQIQKAMAALGLLPQT